MLKDKQYKQYNKLSRYSIFPIYYNDTTNRYNQGSVNRLKNTTSATLYQIKQGDTLDSIALSAYNNPTYYWILADFNRINDPFINLPIGYYLFIPSLSNIEFED